MLQKITLILLMLAGGAFPACAENFDRRIDSLSVDFVSTPFPDFDVELLGFKLRQVNGDVGRSGKINVLHPGNRYLLSLMWRVLRPGHISKDMLLYVADAPLKRIFLDLKGAQVGAVYKEDRVVHIPRYLPAQQGVLALVYFDGDKEFERFEIASLDIGQMQDLVSNTLASPVNETENLLNNGSFEAQFSHWIGPTLPGYRFNIDTQTRYDGQNALRVDFAGGLDYSYYGPGQDVAVVPGGEYVLTAFFKSDHIVSGMGPSIEIFNPQWSQTTPPITGKQDWHQIRHPFRVPDHINEVRIRLRRYGGDGIGQNPYHLSSYGPIQGALWVDHIMLKQLH